MALSSQAKAARRAKLQTRAVPPTITARKHGSKRPFATSDTDSICSSAGSVSSGSGSSGSVLPRQLDFEQTLRWGSTDSLPSVGRGLDDLMHVCVSHLRLVACMH